MGRIVGNARPSAAKPKPRTVTHDAPASARNASRGGAAPRRAPRRRSMNNHARHASDAAMPESAPGSDPFATNRGTTDAHASARNADRQITGGSASFELKLHRTVT